jgi:hypothetical protein
MKNADLGIIRFLAFFLIKVGRSYRPIHESGKSVCTLHHKLIEVSTARRAERSQCFSIQFNNRNRLKAEQQTD